MEAWFPREGTARRAKAEIDQEMGSYYLPILFPHLRSEMMADEGSKNLGAIGDGG